MGAHLICVRDAAHGVPSRQIDLEVPQAPMLGTENRFVWVAVRVILLPRIHLLVVLHKILSLQQHYKRQRVFDCREISRLSLMLRAFKCQMSLLPYYTPSYPCFWADWVGRAYAEAPAVPQKTKLSARNDGDRSLCGVPTVEERALQLGRTIVHLRARYVLTSIGNLVSSDKDTAYSEPYRTS